MVNNREPLRLGRTAAKIAAALCAAAVLSYLGFRLFRVGGDSEWPVVVPLVPGGAIHGTAPPEIPENSSVRSNRIVVPSDIPAGAGNAALRETGTASTGTVEQVRREMPPKPQAVGLDDETIITFTDGTTMAAFLGGPGYAGIKVVDTIREWNMVRVRAESGEALRRFLASVPGALDHLPNIPVALPNKAPRVREARPDDYLAFGASALPWLGVKPGNDTWGKGVTVAVLDVGIGQVSALNEQNIERIDLVQGGASDPAVQSNGHGTAVAAILAGTSGDAQGISPASRLLSIKVLDDDGTGDSFTLAKGIIEAANRNARVINICIGSQSDSPVLRRAVEYAIAKGCAVVAAAGNDGDSGVAYPAKYPGVIAVSAVDAAGRQLPFAGAGPEVDIAAPGLGVRSVWTNNAAVDFSGTSAAVPFVSGALAALLSETPSLSPGDAADLLLRYADDAGAPGKDSEFGCGILSVGRVMSRNTRGIYDAAVSDHHIAGLSQSGSTVLLTVSVQNRGTEPVTKAELKVKAGAQEYSMAVTDLGVGETIACRVDVPRSEIAASGALNVDSLVLLRGAEDAVPANNFKRTTLFLQKADPAQ